MSHILHHHNRDDHFRWHRLALSVVAPDLTVTDLSRLLSDDVAVSDLAFADFLFANGLASYWHDRVEALGAACDVTVRFMNALKRERFAEAAFYLPQKSALRELDNLFESENVTYATMKGAHVRELVYEDPALRPANDIDILVSRHQTEAAVQALTRAGFELRANAENINEATFNRASLQIDLHWNILRPGRTRVDITQSMLSRRKRIDNFWGLDDADTVFLMLVHPAFTKYICSPNMGLIRVVDFVLWLRKRPVDWDSISEALYATGLKAAAWAVLQWFTMVLEPTSLPVPRTFIDGLRPGPLRSAYLNYWLRHDLSTRWLSKPLLIQLGLTLPLHDRVSDCRRAIAARIRGKQNDIRSIWQPRSML